MAWESEARAPWYVRFMVHIVLGVGAVFYLLPLIWMMAISFKPLSETMKNPNSVTELFVGKGYTADIQDVTGKMQTFDVVIERDMKPLPKGPDGKVPPYYIVQPLKDFSAGELWMTFGPDTWKTLKNFGKEERVVMDKVLTPEHKVLSDDKNVFTPDRTDPATGTLMLMSGNKVPAKLLRTVVVPEVPEDKAAAEAAAKSKLVLVREWRKEDTDTKGVGSTDKEVTRPWDIKAADDPTLVISTRFIPYNYPVGLKRTNFWQSFLNTLFLCTMCVLGAVFSSVLVAYGFAFLEFKGRDVLFGLTLATMMIPFVITMIPVYLLFRNFDWINSFKPLWVTSWFGGAFFIFLLRQFFLGLPKDLLDAARIDGCTELEILWHVIVPLARPAIAMVALFTFIGTWKDFMGPLIYLNHPSQFTLSLSLQSFQAEHGGTPWHLLMAAATVFSLPLIILFFLTMKTFIRGIAMTGIKG
jgi:multiple sugar transport system permease protein